MSPKLKLDPDDLLVLSFDPLPQASGKRGTVQANSWTEDYTCLMGCETADYTCQQHTYFDNGTCLATCRPSVCNNTGTFETQCSRDPAWC
ncbi:MAG TPA: hypothetical protein VGB15_12235 [Longimicrobium sp.]|jgi:hypothetical protein